MRTPKIIWVYGHCGYSDSKWFTINRRDYKLILGRGYGSFGEYNDTLIAKNKNDWAYESIILERLFAKARSWTELELLSAIYRG